jgi:hypothetical protein
MSHSEILLKDVTNCNIVLNLVIVKGAVGKGQAIKLIQKLFVTLIQLFATLKPDL